jgi:hypothetical protein
MKVVADIDGIESGLFGRDCVIEQLVGRVLFCSGFPT